MCATARKCLVCSTQLFSRSHPRKHPADPPEHLERSVGLRPSGGRPTRSRACFVITGGGEGVKVVGATSHAASGRTMAAPASRVRPTSHPA